MGRTSIIAYPRRSAPSSAFSLYERWITALLLIAVLAANATAALRLEIDDHRDARYMPYSVSIVDANHDTPYRYSPYDYLRVFQAKRDSGPPAIVMSALNPKSGEDLPAQVTLQTYPDLLCEADNSIWLELTDYCTYFDTHAQSRLVAGAGYRRDSLFVFKLDPNTGERRLAFITSGRDQTGDGKWRGHTKCVGAIDFDYDGRAELFWYVDPIRDLQPRTLICIEMEDLTVEWSIPMASAIHRGQLCNIGTRADPGILAVTAPSGMGVSDSLFSDAYAYLVRIGTCGHLISTQVIGRDRENCALWKCLLDSSIYLVHSQPLTVGEVNGDTTQMTSYVTRFGPTGELRAQVKEDEPLADVWTADFNDDGSPEVYTLSRTGVVRVYDTLLSLVAQSGETILTEMTCLLPAFGAERSVFVFGDRSGGVVYDRRMRPLARLPFYAGYAEGLEFSGDGEMLSMVASFESNGATLRVQERGLLDFIAIVYMDHQKYVLAALSSFLIGLLVTQYYSRRVAAQKRKLEVALNELARTHQELQRAQETILEQEKHKQAKDIAGGFAHEIRNALFPAETAYLKLTEASSSSEDLDRDRIARWIASSHEAVERAISLTHAVSSYVTLDLEYTAECTDIATVLGEVLSANSERITAQSVQITQKGPASCRVLCGRINLFIILNNLMLNSLDALTNRPNSLIYIEWIDHDNTASIVFRDNGQGIAEKDLPRIFDVFFSTKPTLGRGLGLAMVRRMLELCGGMIDVRSTAGTGTEFRIDLMLDPEPPN